MDRRFLHSMMIHTEAKIAREDQEEWSIFTALPRVNKQIQELRATC